MKKKIIQQCSVTLLAAEIAIPKTSLLHQTCKQEAPISEKDTTNTEGQTKHNYWNCQTINIHSSQI
jgi:hypothetical protein